MQVLERDSVNVELRFDLEAGAAETDRLRRRVRELQASVRSQGAGHPGGGGGAKDGAAVASRPAGGRFKRERYNCCGVFFVVCLFWVGSFLKGAGSQAPNSTR